MTPTSQTNTECLERHAVAIDCLDRQVHRALGAVGLHMTGSPFYWSEDARKPDLVSGILDVFVAGLIPLLVGPTAAAKSLLLEAILRLLVGPRLSVIWCSAYLDPSSVFERIVATSSGPAIADRDFGVALVLEEITKALGGAPVTTLKRLLSHGFACIGMTANPLGASYYAEPPDLSLVSRTAAFTVHEATTVADRHARLEQRLLNPGDVSGLGPLLDAEKRIAVHAVLEARDALAMVPIENNALELLLVADGAACVHRGGGSAAHQGERCSSCPCHTSGCGTLPSVPNLGMRLSALARATALRLAAPGQPPIVGADLLRLWLPALTLPEQRIAPVKDRSHAADRGLAWWDGLVAATAVFKSRFDDLLEQLEAHPERVLTTPQRLAIEAFSNSVNPNPVALLDLARIRGRRQPDQHRAGPTLTPDTALSLAANE